jgi:hypothetical protein
MKLKIREMGLVALRERNKKYKRLLGFQVM